MSKDKFKEALRGQYPQESEEVLELAWHLHDIQVAKQYIAILTTCNENADVATKAIRAMYVSDTIDRRKALSEVFIRALLPFTCMSKTPVPHSVVYHVRKMLDDEAVKAERKAMKERKRFGGVHHQPGQPIGEKVELTIHLHLTAENSPLFHQFLALLQEFRVCHLLYNNKV